MSGDITQLTTGGILAVLVIKGAVELVKAGNAKKANGVAKKEPNGKIDRLYSLNEKMSWNMERLANTAEKQLEETRELNTTLHNRPCLRKET